MVGAGSGKGVGAAAQQQNPDGTLPRPQDPMHQASLPGTIPPLDAPAGGGGANGGLMKEERVKALNDDRRKRLEDDVSKLMALTTELKADVDKSNKDELSLQVMRKAAEIEKLAHDVQSRMKN